MLIHFRVSGTEKNKEGRAEFAGVVIVHEEDRNISNEYIEGAAHSYFGDIGMFRLSWFGLYSGVIVNTRVETYFSWSCHGHRGLEELEKERIKINK